MSIDLTLDLINATVQVEQPLPGGARTVGTGFLVSDPTPDGRPRVVLVTAEHVFEQMPGDKATIGYRTIGPDGVWHFAPQKIRIRQGGRELWTHHPSRDVAVIAVEAPPAFAKAAIPVGWLADDAAFDQQGLQPGDTMMALGFPQGLSANSAGFPILRSGRVASYPLGPATQFPTFLLDFRVFPGNSGGPIWLEQTRQLAGESAPEPVVAGILTQEVELDHENLGIGIVTDARFVRETLADLDHAAAEPLAPGTQVAASYGTQASAKQP
ncbi:MAG TPA: serine protease [Caulobacteraceae bacterium]|nr:serine protease [Caulobacteraceae bacterium]